MPEKIIEAINTLNDIQEATVEGGEYRSEHVENARQNLYLALVECEDR